MRYSKIRLMVTPRPPSADGSVFITVTANGLQSSNGVKAVKAKTTSICSSQFLRMAKCWLDKPWKMSAEDLRTRTWNHRNSEVEIDLAFIAKLGTNRLAPHQFHAAFLCFTIRAEAWKPLHIRLTLEPGNLPFGVIAVGLLGGGNRFRQRQRALEILHGLPVTQGIQRTHRAVAL